MTALVKNATTSACEQQAQQFNNQCHCPLDKAALYATLQNSELTQLFEEREHLFSDAVIFVAQTTIRKQQAIIDAVEKVIALPRYQEQVLGYAPDTARFIAKTHGVFFGYDFHLNENKPQLIEINSNAGGALVNALLVQSQKNCCVSSNDTHVSDALETVFMTMFFNEWQAERGSLPLRTIAIVDENPQTQYMLPEFLLFQKLFAAHNIDAIICDPSELAYRNGTLWHDAVAIDLVYNRLTDFGLEDATQQALCEAYMANDVVLTPHPRAHALYANKKNLALLTNDAALEDLGVDAQTRATLLDGIAHTVSVNADDAVQLWAARKKLFFKPDKGYGSKAAYRGDKLTKRVFNAILQSDYVAQQLVQPSERQLWIANQCFNFKLDLRHYVYQGQTQLLSARLYQGQTTNFRTANGGFARVVVVPCSD